MNTRRIFCTCAAAFLLLAVIGSTPLLAQERVVQKLAVLPLQGADWPPDDAAAVSAQLASILQSHPQFAVLDLGTVEIPALDMSRLVPQLRQLAPVLRADLILVPELQRAADTCRLKLYLYDTQRRRIIKIAAQPAPCEESEVAALPLQKSVRTLIETPEIILTVDVPAEAPALPPPAPAPVAPDTTAVEAPPDSLSLPAAKQIPVPVARPGGRWKTIAAGAAVVGGSLLYFLTRGRKGATIQRLPDPPGPPDAK